MTAFVTISRLTERDGVCYNKPAGVCYFLKGQRFYMAILDIMVPGVSGLTVLAHIREPLPEPAMIML